MPTLCVLKAEPEEESYFLFATSRPGENGSRGVVIRRVRSPLLSQVHERESPSDIDYDITVVVESRRSPQLFSSVRKNARDQRLLLLQRSLREPSTSILTPTTFTPYRDDNFSCTNKLSRER